MRKFTKGGMSLFDFAQSVGAVVVISRYREQRRFCCKLEDNSTIERDVPYIKNMGASGGGSTCTGDGATLKTAINDYVRQIRGKILVFDGRSRKGTEIPVPENLTLFMN